MYLPVYLVIHIHACMCIEDLSVIAQQAKLSFAHEYVCVCVCVCVLMCASLCVCLCAYTYAHIHICTHTVKHTCMHTQTGSLFDMENVNSQQGKRGRMLLQDLWDS